MERANDLQVPELRVVLEVIIPLLSFGALVLIEQRLHQCAEADHFLRNKFLLPLTNDFAMNKLLDAQVSIFTDFWLLRRV